MRIIIKICLTSIMDAPLLCKSLSMISYSEIGTKRHYTVKFDPTGLRIKIIRIPRP